MPTTLDPLINTFIVPGSPEELKAWWTEIPEVYEAEDPREQPHRIELVEQTEDGAVYDTYWRGPLGLEFRLRETLHDEGAGRWRFVVPSPGFVIEDRYTAEPREQGDGTELTIRSTVTYTSWWGKLTRKIMIPSWRDQLTETFTAAVEVYRDERG